MVTVLIVVLLLGISSKSFAEQILPLEVGRWWEYRKHDSASSQNEWVMRSEVTDTITFGTQEYYLITDFNYEPGKAPDEDATMLRSTDTAVYAYDEERGAEYLAFQLAPIGTQWLGDEWQGGREHYEIFDITQVTVPYGTFENAYVFRTYEENDGQPNSPYNYDYVVPGIGLIKSVDSIYVELTAPPNVAELVRTGVTPEPVSSLLFMLGGAVLGIRNIFRRNKV